MAGFGTPACPLVLADRAAYRHASLDGRTVLEIEGSGRAAAEVRDFYT